ncbi:MAG: hypothetical protein OEU32_11285 [Acidimicrobiia bacterium]|nr:hypothetical protein [Acidimicrobiia bacterium]
MFQNLKPRMIPLLPIVLLISLAGFGIANALQDTGDEIDLGPQPGDFIGADGEPDLTGYLIASGLFPLAPNVPAGEPIEFRVFGCAEGEPITISIVPRILRADEQTANDALADDDASKLAEEPVPVVELDEALADGTAYAFEIPTNIPPGFARLRVSCTGIGGDAIEWDTMIDVVDRGEFEAAQENLGDDEDPEELTVTIDADDPPAADDGDS